MNSWIKFNYAWCHRYTFRAFEDGIHRRVAGEFPSQLTDNAELHYLLCSEFEEAVRQTVELHITDAMALMWRHYMQEAKLTRNPLQYTAIISSKKSDDLTYLCPVVPHGIRQLVNIASGNGLVPNRHQTITWTNTDLITSFGTIFN